MSARNPFENDRAIPGVQAPARVVSHARGARRTGAALPVGPFFLRRAHLVSPRLDRGNRAARVGSGAAADGDRTAFRAASPPRTVSAHRRSGGRGGRALCATRRGRTNRTLDHTALSSAGAAAARFPFGARSRTESATARGAELSRWPRARHGPAAIGAGEPRAPLRRRAARRVAGRRLG